MIPENDSKDAQKTQNSLQAPWQVRWRAPARLYLRQHVLVRQNVLLEKNSLQPMQTLQRKRCQTRTRPRKKACVYGVRVSGATIFGYVEGNPLSMTDPEGLVGIYNDGSVNVNAYPGPPAGGNEHARAGAGQNYHVHIRDSSGREVRISTETWKPLTPQDQKIYDQSKPIRNFCDGLSPGEKKFYDRVNRQVFHKGYPTINQTLRIGGGRGRAGGRSPE